MEIKDELNEKGDLNISGSSSSNGGEYRNVKVSGSAKINGYVRCIHFRASGSSRINGSVNAQDVSTSGSTRIQGNLNCEDLGGSGSFKVEGNIESEMIKTSGSFTVKGKTSAQEIHTSGSSTFGDSVKTQKIHTSGNLKINGNCDAELFESCGGFNINGLLNAETADINVQGRCEVNEIGGNKINVYSKTGIAGLLNFISVFSDKTLYCKVIEGDDIELSNVTCDLVRGRNIILNENCKIKKVEYDENFENRCNCEVKDVVKNN
ncbi:MAG: cell shape determination protein CcmA [Inconstantimicrobium porci]|uniref:cell shape determination protein CcmA n=1 Tax=Inconstantimicrobium porci TaxID=2652291 RepID=UPI002A91F2E2|nr:cell shape determination protein CcmA [Inconstantimicrobium porci]MDY5911465.1 cell shape determination protein CcmA [Inconstantimicrobium porci]